MRAGGHRRPARYVRLALGTLGARLPAGYLRMLISKCKEEGVTMYEEWAERWRALGCS